MPSTVIGDVVPAERHRQDEHRHAGARQRDRRFGHVALVLQRRDRAVDRREDGPVAERSARRRPRRSRSAGRRAPARAPRPARACVSSRGRWPRSRGPRSGGRGRGPRSTARRSRPRGRASKRRMTVPQRRRGALAALPGHVVEHVGAGAVGAERERPVADDHVVRRVAPGEQHLAAAPSPGSARRAPTAAWP